MYQNHTRQTPINRNTQSYIRQAVIAYEERMAFVESVCAALNESRFGSGHASWSVVKLSNRPELEPAVFFELSNDEVLPWYALLPVGHDGHQVIKAEYRKAKQMGLSEKIPDAGNSSAHLVSNLGRGSP